jgi:hypothetical protein
MYDIYELNQDEINQVTGGDMDDVYIIGAATGAAFLVGSCVGTPVFGAALAASVFGHVTLIRALG